MNMDQEDLLFLERVSEHVIDPNPEPLEYQIKRKRTKESLQRKVQQLTQMIEQTEYYVELAKNRLKEIKQKEEDQTPTTKTISL